MAAVGKMTEWSFPTDRRRVDAISDVSFEVIVSAPDIGSQQNACFMKLYVTNAAQVGCK